MCGEASAIPACGEAWTTQSRTASDSSIAAGHRHAIAAVAAARGHGRRPSPPICSSHFVAIRGPSRHPTGPPSHLQPAEGTEIVHGDLALLQEIRKPSGEARLGLRVVVRFQLQKNALMSGTFEPPEMYSTALS